MTKIGRESHARPGLLTVGWELRTINSRFSHRMKVPGTQMETTTKVIVTDQIGRERENMNDRERQREHTHTHTHGKKFPLRGVCKLKFYSNYRENYRSHLH